MNSSGRLSDEDVKQRHPADNLVESVEALSSGKSEEASLLIFSDLMMGRPTKFLQLVFVKTVLVLIIEESVSLKKLPIRSICIDDRKYKAAAFYAIF